MRVLVCGSRSLPDALPFIAERLRAVGATVVIEGGANGADRQARAAALVLGLHVMTFEADWGRGRRAGPLRNQEMLEAKPALVLAFHTDPKLGKGTADMVARAEQAGVPVEVHLL